MKKKIIFLLIGMCVLTGCSKTGEKPLPAPEPTPIVTAEPHEPSVSKLDGQFLDTEQAEVEYTEYIGNKNSKKFHTIDCHTLPKEKNRVEFTSRDEAVNDGYFPCRNCQP